jgi:hypothetical protein
MGYACLGISVSVRTQFATKTSLAVSSIVILVCSFDEREIGIRLSGGGGHGVMIRPRNYFLIRI